MYVKNRCKFQRKEKGSWLGEEAPANPVVGGELVSHTRARITPKRMYGVCLRYVTIGIYIQVARIIHVSAPHRPTWYPASEYVVLHTICMALYISGPCRRRIEGIPTGLARTNFGRSRYGW